MYMFNIRERRLLRCSSRLLDWMADVDALSSIHIFRGQASEEYDVVTCNKIWWACEGCLMDVLRACEGYLMSVWGTCGGHLMSVLWAFKEHRKIMWCTYEMCLIFVWCQCNGKFLGLWSALDKLNMGVWWTCDGWGEGCVTVVSYPKY